jgi:microcin C transport system permease protein
VLAYLIRRLLLVFPTLLGITVACFTLIQFVPGGPVEEMIAKVKQVGSERGSDASRTISPQEVANIKAYFGFDKPAHVRYWIWLKNVVRLDLGNSYAHNKPVWEVIKSKFPVSLFFGLTSLFLSYLICIPLGLAKALKHRSGFDTVTSVLTFAGYVIPGYALGVLFIIFLAGGSYLDLFPLGGVVSDEFESLPFFGKVQDFLWHMTLPLACYMASEFAFLTQLLKNSLLEEMSKDYMRTAVTKGLTFKQAVWRHALRNALVPLATRAGEAFTVMFAGAVLIEKVFDIDGMGLLFYTSITNRDYNVVMGLILLMSFMGLLGRLFSDFMYVVVDPRIRFN